MLLAAFAITLFLDTQNNVVHGEQSTMEVTGILHGDPVPACAQLYLYLWKNNVPADTPICDYYVSVGAAPKSITGSNIVELLQATEK